MILETKALKVSSALAVPILYQVLPFDILWIPFILLGLLLGWLARIGRMVGQNRSTEDMKRDMIVSLLIGGGNGLLATLIIASFGLTYLEGVGVAFLCAFAGVRTLENATRWLFKKIKEDL